MEKLTLKEALCRCLEVIERLRTEHCKHFKILCALDKLTDMFSQLLIRYSEIGLVVPRSVAEEMRGVTFHIGSNYTPFLETYFSASHPVWKEFADLLFSIHSEVSDLGFRADITEAELVCRLAPVEKNEEVKEVDSKGLAEINPYLVTKEGVENWERRCGGCWEVFEKMARCGKCRTVGYCGKRCQTAHWPFHKEDCRRIRQESPSIETN